MNETEQQDHVTDGGVELVVVDGVTELHISGMATAMAQAIADIATTILAEDRKHRLAEQEGMLVKPVVVRALTRGLAMTLVVTKSKPRARVARTTPLLPGNSTVTKLAQAVSLDRARKAKTERGAHKVKVLAHP